MRRALRERIEAPGFVVSLQDADLAAEERLEEGRFLVVNGYFAAGVYLLGYVAETLLKTAYVRVAHPRARPGYNLGAALREAHIVGGVLLPYTDPDGFHSIRFWAMLLEGVRRGQEREMAAVLRLPFEAHTEYLHRYWKVDMRYLPGDVRPAEAVQYESSVLWLRTNHVAFWS